MLVLQKTLKPAKARPPQPIAEEAAARLSISVVFTSVEATLAALAEAGRLATSLRARITLLVPQVVPYVLPLESPPVLLEWNERRFEMIARQSPVETTVRIYLCRDRIETVRSALSSGSLVVVGCRKTWWPSSEKRLAYKLRRYGHEVILAKAE